MMRGQNIEKRICVERYYIQSKRIYERMIRKKED